PYGSARPHPARPGGDHRHPHPHRRGLEQKARTLGRNDPTFARAPRYLGRNTDSAEPKKRGLRGGPTPTLGRTRCATTAAFSANYAVADGAPDTIRTCDLCLPRAGLNQFTVVDVDSRGRRCRNTAS